MLRSGGHRDQTFHSDFTTVEGSCYETLVKEYWNKIPVHTIIHAQIKVSMVNKTDFVQGK